ncbi:MAG: cytochrome c peroxidase [Phycisphaeraceae bacterium]
MADGQSTTPDGSDGDPGTGIVYEPEKSSVRQEPLRPIPLSVELDKRKVKLGHALFHDARLSIDGTVSCASCHNLETGGTNRMRFSVGVGSKRGLLNAPTVFNSGFNFRQFWDGRAKSLEDQVEGPLTDDHEMGSSFEFLLSILSKDKSIVEQFDSIYETGLSREAVKDAIATFERSLITPNGRFDRWLRNDDSALSAEELKGYALFKSLGCVSCHQGVNVGGNMFEKFGVMKKAFAEGEDSKSIHFGRYNVTKNVSDKYVFKVPSLRNVAITPPYFHDGSAGDLNEAVRRMAEYNVGRILSDAEVSLITSFLKTLTGEYKGRPLDGSQ